MSTVEKNVSDSISCDPPNPTTILRTHTHTHTHYTIRVLHIHVGSYMYMHAYMYMYMYAYSTPLRLSWSISCLENMGYNFADITRDEFSG